MIINVIMSSGREYIFNSEISDITITRSGIYVINKKTDSETRLCPRHIESINYREATETDRISWGTSD